MDRMKACGAFDRGSNPLGRTEKGRCGSFTFAALGPLLRKEKAMKEAQKLPINRCLGSNCPKNPDQAREEAVRAALQKAAEEKIRQRARAVINDLLKLSKGSLIRLLPMIVRRVALKEYPRLVLVVLLERIRANQWDKLSQEDKCLVIQTEASLEKQTS